MTTNAIDTNASPRIEGLKNAVQTARPSICPERALIWTRYFRQRENRKKPALIHMAEALSKVLAEKSLAIYPDELIVGNFSSYRVGGALFPELHGLPVLMDLLKFRSRKTNPLYIRIKDMLGLVSIVFFWMFRFLAIRADFSFMGKIRFIVDQLTAHYYLINESGGISHFAPDYERLIRIGTDGFSEDALARQEKTAPGSEQWLFYEGVKIACEGLAGFGERYARLATSMASAEKDPARRAELEQIAKNCARVPRQGAATFYEAVQSLFFAQIALNMESLDNSVCPGRMDQYLFPYYERDIAAGSLTRERAKEILSCFSIKMSEIIPVFSKHMTNFHGGMFNGQVVTVGGVDRDGRDATNELSFIFLEIMDELRMRQPNYHARVHAGSPEGYMETISAMLASGSNSPALYGDETIIDTMVKHGYSVEDARDYTAVGCVEPVCQGRSFSSTDAAIFNVPITLEMALNCGRRFGRPYRSGAKTKPAQEMKSMDEVRHAFETQLAFKLGHLVSNLKIIEKANRDFHPTPLTSMLIKGCLESGTCSTAGGAMYNFSGIQCVGPADVGDALYNIEKIVFKDKRLSLTQLLSHLKTNFADEKIRLLLKGQEKFGNDSEEVDRHVIYVIDRFADILQSHGQNTRGGQYTVGLYSVTSHEYFGRITGALPNGRRKKESFASGIAPENGMDQQGPTAMLNSVTRIDLTRIANGINLNARLDPHAMRGRQGVTALGHLIRAYFKRGGMQVQMNVLDPEILVAARKNPHLHPNLLVRVSGYSAYFADLTPKMQDEIIQRTAHGFGAAA
ncbi:MAG: formate acetyltransferase [Deltaproteobacteria bacterium]|nr:formate acetyltransferase [Deltaproteobacteria bacterium]